MLQNVECKCNNTKLNYHFLHYYFTSDTHGNVVRQEGRQLTILTPHGQLLLYEYIRLCTYVIRRGESIAIFHSLR